MLTVSQLFCATVLNPTCKDGNRLFNAEHLNLVLESG